MNLTSERSHRISASTGHQEVCNTTNQQFQFKVPWHHSHLKVPSTCVNCTHNCITHKTLNFHVRELFETIILYGTVISFHLNDTIFATLLAVLLHWPAWHLADKSNHTDCHFAQSERLQKSTWEWWCLPMHTKCQYVTPRDANFKVAYTNWKARAVFSNDV